jgi:hypothetical protein
MFWGCISYFGVVDGNINSEKYISILDDNLWPVVARYFANNPWTLQEDNAPCHVSRRTTAWKTENEILTLP